MVRLPPEFPARPAFTTEAANVVGGDTAKAGAGTVQGVTARSGALRTWAGVAAGFLMDSPTVGTDAGSSATSGHLERGANNSALGEEDADFDDLLAGLTGGAALEGEQLRSNPQHAMPLVICSWPGYRPSLDRGRRPQPDGRFLRLTRGLSGQSRIMRRFFCLLDLQRVQ